jgi:phospho-N-acetylmuramoyl-pentapeptide-transferase
MVNLQVILDTYNLEQVILFGFFSFIVSMVLTPIYTTAAFAGQWWEKIHTHSVKGKKDNAPHQLQNSRHVRSIPTMAGIVFILSAIIVTVACNLSRSETWLPLAAMIGAGAIGLLDDFINIRGIDGKAKGLQRRVKSALLFSVALIGGLWFYLKLDVSSVHIPFFENWYLGWLVVPLFVLVVFATGMAVNISDGLDGLAGGLAAIAFGAYAVIALLEEKYGIAGFCMTIVGALLSYTWFNIYPARFNMGNTGSFALGTALGVVAMLTDTVFLLPVIGIIFVAEVGSVITQKISMLVRGGKSFFLLSPIHNHFIALGWPETKVTMRFWVIGQVAAFICVVVFILGGSQ